MYVQKVSSVSECSCYSTLVVSAYMCGELFTTEAITGEVLVYDLLYIIQMFKRIESQYQL